MRDIIFLIASIAGAAILTAVAVLLAPESPFWKWILWGGIGVLTACACVLLVDYLKPGGNVFALMGIWAGIALAITFSIAFAVGSSALKTTPHATHDASSPQIILRNVSDPSIPDEPQSYTVSWSPLEWLCFRASDYESSSVLKEPRDKTLTFYLLNLGPGDLRNARVRWSIKPDQSIKDVIESKIFDGFVKSYSAKHISFDNQKEACFLPLSEMATIDVPKLSEAKSPIKIIMPEGTTNRYWISILALAKEAETRAGGALPRTPHEVLLHQNQQTSRMPSVYLDISHGGKTESFVVDGVVSATSPHPTLSQDGPNRTARVPENGIGAWLQNVQITRK